MPPEAPPRTVPLKDITITWPYSTPWEADTKPVTIPAERLALFLNEAAARAEHKTPIDYVDEAHGVASRLHGVSHILFSLSQSEWWESHDMAWMLEALADYVSVLRLRIASSPESKRFEQATVTIGEPANAEASR